VSSSDAFVVFAVITATHRYVKNRRGGKLFVVEAFTEVVCSDDVLGGVETTVLFSGETRGTVCDHRQSSSVA
jgi:hypothetical protein